jgi:Derlin-2/3
VLIAFHLLTGGNPFSDLVGVAAGHTYYYLKHVLPESHGYNLLKTPSWIDFAT